MLLLLLLVVVLLERESAHGGAAGFCTIVVVPFGRERDDSNWLRARRPAKHHRTDEREGKREAASTASAQWTLLLLVVGRDVGL